MKKYIYLDWNVIQYMKRNIVVAGKFDAEQFNLFVNSYKNKFSFPISEGHLRDLSATYNEETKKYVEEDLSFIRKMSNGLMLGVSHDESEIRPIPADIQDQFRIILNEVHEDSTIKVTGGGSHRIDMSKLSKNSLFRPHLEKNGGIMNDDVMEKTLLDMLDNIDNPDSYKQLRSEVSILQDVINDNDVLLSKDSPYFKKIEAVFKVGQINDLAYLRENFDKIFDSFLAIDGRKRSNLSTGKLIETAYMLLDFTPLFRDRINKKNRPSNMHRDIKNFYFASHAKFYVTEDDATYKKSKFVAKFLGLKVKVVKMDELRHRLTCL
ncbi:hypothetical protein AB4543_21800 [Vibrio splendidus]